MTWTNTAYTTSLIVQRTEAIENARDVVAYLHKTMSARSIIHNYELSQAIVRFVRFVWQQWHGQLPIPPGIVRDVQYISGELLSMKLTGRIAWDDPHYELAMDRLSAMEAGRTGPTHRDRLFAPSELAELAASWERPRPLDFVTLVGLKCDCPSRVVYVVIHDGTPSAKELQSECVALYGHGCGTLQHPDPTTIGECRDAPGGVMGVANDAIGRMMLDGLPVRGPYWYRDETLLGWDPDLCDTQSEAA